ncbi:MAG: T9SS type A sorting domain-containing protein [Pyrinomonadaceae bacterium]|nr:T9SS type A sorting domain-containing protein [Pyrinomonadaceae bacterium]
MKKLTDEQLDLVIKNLLKDSALDSETLGEIADSPNILWNIKREINQQQKQRGWIWDFRWLVPTFVSMALLIAFGLFWSIDLSKNKLVTEITVPKIEIVEPKTISTEFDKTEIIKTVDSTKTEQVTKKTQTVKVLTKQNQTKIDSVKSNQIKTLATPKAIDKVKQSTKITEKQTQEYKTDFISLSYLPTPESGQIVRVKVPRALMISLGVTNNVSKNPINQIVSIWPNPANHTIHIQLSQSGDKQIRVLVTSLDGTIHRSVVYNASGRILQEDISHLPPGIYVVQVHLGDHISSRTIIKNSH